MNWAIHTRIPLLLLICVFFGAMLASAVFHSRRALWRKRKALRMEVQKASRPPC